MKEEIIRKFATSYGPWLDYCTMRIGNFRIPKYIVIGNNIISLEDHRDKLIRQDSSWAPKFEGDINILRNRCKQKFDRELDYVREFPVFIQNKNLWETLKKKYNIEKIKQNTNYFVVDYLFYNLNIIIEIDSGFHISSRNYDRARDEYISREYGIYTYRLENYGLNINDIEKLRTILNQCEYNKIKCNINSKFIINYDTIISELFKKLYYKSINKVDEIINTYYDKIFPTIEYRNSINRLTINYGSFSGMTNDEINCTDTMLRWIYGINLNIINGPNPYICE